MKKLFLIYLFIVLSPQIFSQITYEKGYLINNEGIRTDGLLKISDWRKNPADFYFMSSEAALPVKMTIDSVTEFGIIGNSRYIRKKVKIDRSGELIRELSIIREPVFNEEVLFLRVLVEGKHCLYEYITGNNLRRYFIESDNTEIEQLIYKTYLFDNKNIAKNNDFRKQLWLHLKCDDITIARIEKIEYDSKSLALLFEKFNQCDHTAFKRYEKKARYDNFNLTVKPGINFSTFEISNPISKNLEMKIESAIGFQVGCEFEFVMPFNKYKWAIFAEPGYMSVKAEGRSKYTPADLTYHSLELPIGLRYYFFPGNNSKIYINVSAIVSNAINSEIIYYYQPFLVPGSNLNASFGLGYKYKNRFNFEVRAATKRALQPWIIDKNCISILLGYSVF
jgi:hypothetical protein